MPYFIVVYLRIHRITQHHSAWVLSCMKKSSSTAIRTDLPAHKSTCSVNRKTKDGYERDTDLQVQTVCSYADAVFLCLGIGFS